MTQVSRRPMPKDLQVQMYKAIHKAFADLRREEEVAAFLEDLLTPTERVMLAKRLAIAILLDRGYDQRAVHTITRTSLTTVHTVNYWLRNKGNGYRLVLDKLKMHENWKEIQEGLEKVIEEVFSNRKKFATYIPKDTPPRDRLL